jgi:hypothetical protein
VELGYFVFQDGKNEEDKIEERKEKISSKAKTSLKGSLDLGFGVFKKLFEIVEEDEKTIEVNDSPKKPKKKKIKQEEVMEEPKNINIEEKHNITGQNNDFFINYNPKILVKQSLSNVLSIFDIFSEQEIKFIQLIKKNEKDNEKLHKIYNNPKYAPFLLRKDVVMEILKLDPGAIYYIPQKFKNDIEIGKILASININYLKYLSPDVQRQLTENQGGISQ